MKELKEYFDVAVAFHGHKCPAMPMGLRAGLAAMKALGVERAKDKELVVESETGEGNAAGASLTASWWRPAPRTENRTSASSTTARWPSH